MLDLEITMKNNLYFFIIINGLMKELQEYEKKHPLELANSGRAPLLNHLDKVDPEFAEFEKSIS